MSRTPPGPDIPAPPPSSIANARTLPEMFEARTALTRDAPAYRQWDSGSGEWIDWTWRKISEEVGRWRRALAGEQFPGGSRIATLMANGVDYVCVDQAALSLGLVIVPMHTTDNPGNVAYILADSGAAALIIDNLDYWARLALQTAGLSGLKRVVVASRARSLEDRPIETDARVVGAWRWLEAAPRQDIGAHALPGGLAAIVYTSGTT